MGPEFVNRSLSQSRHCYASEVPAAASFPLTAPPKPSPTLTLVPEDLGISALKVLAGQLGFAMSFGIVDTQAPASLYKPDTSWGSLRNSSPDYSGLQEPEYSN